MSEANKTYFALTLHFVTEVNLFIYRSSIKLGTIYHVPNINIRILNVAIDNR